MMKGIRGLLEKDFRLFFRQGGNLFLVLVFVALFFILTGKTAAAFIAMYIPSVLAIYSGNTISYDENGHGYTYSHRLVPQCFKSPISRHLSPYRTPK